MKNCFYVVLCSALKQTCCAFVVRESVTLFKDKNILRLKIAAILVYSSTLHSFLISECFYPWIKSQTRILQKLCWAIGCKTQVTCLPLHAKALTVGLFAFTGRKNNQSPNGIFKVVSTPLRWIFKNMLHKASHSFRKNFSEPILMPVSYTHLTLPTKIGV